MRLGYSLSLQQQQKLVMTPELRQALTILQLPVVELEDYLQKTLMENPVLEVREEPEETPVDAAEGDADGGESDAAKPDAGLVAQWLEFFGLDPEPGTPRYWDDEYDFVAAQAAPAPTLHEHLHAQLRLVTLPPGQMRAAAFLVDSLDDHGYLTLTTAEAAATLQLPEDQVERALRVVQTLDPVGVGARDLQECLLLQWAAVGDGNPLVPRLIREFLDDLAASRIGRIAEALEVSPVVVQAAADALRTLDPKPGRRLGGGEETRYIYPDVAVERVGRDFVVLVSEAGPRLTMSPAYRALLAPGGACDDETRRYLEGKMHSALWLLRSIEQRRVTLYRVTETIVRLQRPFFERGLRHLHPLTLRQVAEELGIHESTVSRAIAGKYGQTPHGLFELKFFFSSGVEGWAGGVSAESVKQLIRDLVSGEDPREPLSDQSLAEALARQGVRISRRTVAKYREDAKIPSSAHRKRY